MKRLLAAAGVIIIAGCAGAVSSQEAKKSVDFTQKEKYVKPVISPEQAKKEVEKYVKGTKYISENIELCEGNRYYIGQIYIEGYEGIDVARKIYVDKITGDLYPTMAETFDYCYMVKR
ncbi:hypothetical protein SAMN06265182_1397 [Persephonella hydrogeniphila]|uniref:Peptidase propeptide and YPEB domain-containing protein n=1 Tax=Persephonella hydrogeniphila TaxID=198703 RepID=A0A285NGZ6_9AQUI|nr:hypothetical protein [Persephonella hydrogeniphila]SNZ08719.1 hypothetical protein SAMN06265182_1397 [Persephonella hydrogeniphila]